MNYAGFETGLYGQCTQKKKSEIPELLASSSKFHATFEMLFFFVNMSDFFIFRMRTSVKLTFLFFASTEN